MVNNLAKLFEPAQRATHLRFAVSRYSAYHSDNIGVLAKDSTMAALEQRKWEVREGKPGPGPVIYWMQRE
ncbi:MAG: hypothetical protein P9M08_12110, partial [Candidatus Erginobacter occultus]|nr:hypothetical protein [Candidatus Erginobacter occultus]